MSVTIVIGRRHLLAGVSVLALTALLGVALVIPAVSDATTYKTRSASCAGVNFEPDNNSASFADEGTERVSNDSSTVYFRCNASLPNGAIVTKVQFTTVYIFADLAPTTCSLVRAGLSATTTIDDVVHLADVTFSTTTGTQRLSDTTIKDATVDNGSYAYWLECGLTQDTGVIGDDVIYKISAANG